MFLIVNEFVFPFIKNLSSNEYSGYSKYMKDALFIIPTPLLLSKVVDKLETNNRSMIE